MTIDLVAGSAVYVDSNVFIYFIEKVPERFGPVQEVFTLLAERQARVLTSELAIAECLYLPARGKNWKLVAVYDVFFGKTGDIAVLPLSGALAKSASLLGGNLGLKLLDAIHYVTAIEAGCAAFLTGDRRIRSSSSLRVIHV